MSMQTDESAQLIPIYICNGQNQQGDCQILFHEKGSQQQAKRAPADSSNMASHRGPGYLGRRTVPCNICMPGCKKGDLAREDIPFDEADLTSQTLHRDFIALD